MNTVDICKQLSGVRNTVAVRQAVMVRVGLVFCHYLTRTFSDAVRLAAAVLYQTHTRFQHTFAVQYKQLQSRIYNFILNR